MSTPAGTPKKNDDGPNGAVSTETPQTNEKIAEQHKMVFLDKSKWKADSNVSQCDGCRAAFSAFRRKHHCRRCGNIFCNNCAPKVFLVTGKAVRICEGCNKSIDGDTAEAIEDALEGTHNLDRIIPAWMFLFYPMIAKQQDLGFGQLTVDVVEAANLLASDYNIGRPSTSDPYVNIKCGEHRVQNASTKVIWKTLSPEWDEKFQFPVYSAKAILSLEVFDKDHIGSDDPLGKVEIPLSGLANQQTVDVWLYLEPCAGQAAEEVPEEKEAATGPSWFKIKAKRGHGIGSHGAKDHSLGAIRLKMHFQYSKVGEFWSHYAPEVGPPDEGPQYELNRLYGNAMKVKDNVMPVVGVFSTIAAILTWQKPVVTWFVLAVLVWLTYYPTLIPAAFHLLILRVLFLNYVEMIGKKALARKIEMADDEDEEVEDIKENATLGWVGSVTTFLPIPASTQESLRGVQNSLGTAGEGTDSFYALWDWSNAATTKGVAIGVICSMIFHLCVSFWTILFFEILLVFFATTKAFTQVMSVLKGTASYFTSSLSRAKVD